MFSRRLVDGASVDWIFEQFEYLIDNFPAAPGLPDSDLWKPIPEHFPKPDGPLGPHLFACVCQQCGFDPNDFDLVAVEPVKSGSLGGLAYTNPVEPAPAGTYQVVGEDEDERREVIEFDADSSALELVTIFAHELSHALFYRAFDAWTGDAALHELLTDVTAIYLGYGIFLSNVRFSFEGYTDAGVQGWQAKGLGYLPEAEMIFATALFMRIKGLPDDAADDHLKPKLVKMLRKAMRQLDRLSPRVEALRTRKPAHAHLQKRPDQSDPD